MKNIYFIESTNGVRLVVSYAGYGKPDLNQLITARNACYSAIEVIGDLIKKEYPLAR